MSLPESILGVLDYSYILSFWRNHKTHKLSSYLKRTKECVFLRTSTKKNETSWQDIIRSSSSHHSCSYQLCNLGKSFTFLGFITIKMNMSTPMDFLSTHLTCTSRIWNVGVGKFLLMLLPSCFKTGIIPLVLCLIFLCYPYLILTSKSARKRV